MKNILVICILTSLSFSLLGQSQERKLFKKKKEKIEQKSIEVQDGPDLAKVGKHLKNAGWSFLGAVITVPVALSTLAADINNPTVPTEATPFQEGLSLASIYGSVFMVCNVGAQSIKAGWELMKSKD